jgi:glycosyltransferase involved in cell wall biosynthesis
MHGLLAPATILRLRSYARRNAVDLIHTHLTRATYMGYIAGLLARVPVVSTIHTLTRDWAYRYLPHYRHWFVAVSRDLQQTMIRRGAPSDRVWAIHNGSDIGRRVSEAASGLSVRAELSVPPDAHLIGVFARVDEFKGQHILVRAARSVVEACPRAYFLFAGHAEPSEQQALWEIAGRDGVADRLRFTGIRDDVARLMEAMDIVALTSVTEACSMAIIEAMTIGKPVIATRAGGNPELIVDGETGILVERTPQAVADAVKRLCLDGSLRASMGRAAHERARAMFTADAMAAGMEDAYRQVLGLRGAAARS